MTKLELNIWIERIERSRALQEEQHKQWNTALELYNCTFFDRVYSGRDPERVDVNFANWYVNNLVNLTYFRDPFIFIKGTHGRWSGFAETLEATVNYYWRDLGMKREMKRAILSAFLMPPGWIKLGYTAKIGQDVAEKDKNVLSNIKSMLLGKENKLPEEQGILNSSIKEESIFASWVPSWNILMPPGYHIFTQMPYIIEYEDIPIIDFKRNPLYKNKSNVSPTHNASNQGGGSIHKIGHTDAMGDDSDSIRLYHIWDRRAQKRIIMSYQDVHFEGGWPYDVDCFNYEPLVFDETLPSSDKSNPYPSNAITPILPQIIENSNSRSMMAKHRKRAGAYILAQKGALTESDINALQNAEAMEICWVDNIEAVKPGPLPQLPPDVFRIDQVIEQDLQKATGMGALMFQAQPGQRTATQASIAQQGLQLKSSARVDAVEDFTVNVARKMAQLLWQFYDREQISEIIGEPVTANMWPDLPGDPVERKKIIQREIQFRVDAGAAAPPKDETIDRKQLLDYASIVSTIAPERIKKDEFIKQLTKKFKFVKDVEKIIISSDEEETRTATEENKLLGANVPQVVGPNENHELHIKIHSQAQKTDALDIHISDHGSFLNISGTKPGPKATTSNPKITGQGITNEGDIYQSTQNLGVGTGPEAAQK